MDLQQPQQFRTRMFARVLGPFFVVVAATTVARASDMRTLLSDFEANAAWPWVTGGFLLLASLVIIALHQYWQGAAAITVSVVGWILALRALFLTAFPHAFMAAANAAIGVSALWVSVGQLHRPRPDVSNLRRLGTRTESGSAASGHINPGSPTRRMMYAQG